MKEILNGNIIIEIIASVTSAIAVFISIYFFKRKGDADRHLIELIKKEEEHLKMQLFKLEETRFELQKKLEEQKLREIEMHKMTIDKIAEQQYNLAQDILEREKMLNKEMEILKYNLLKNNLEHLASKLTDKDRDEILDALKQTSLTGQMNYINRLLHLSGSSESSMIKVEKKD